MIYESYNLPKESPTVGMFFMARDYIEFLSDLKGYVGGKLTFIKPEESRWKEMPQISGDKRFGHYPVGVLSNGKTRSRFSSCIITVSKKLVKSGSGVSSGLTGKSCWLNSTIRMAVQKLKWKSSCRCLLRISCFLLVSSGQMKMGGYTVIHQFPKHDFIMASYEPFGQSKYIDITSVLNNL